ncbi:MAG: DUF4243 domain-containing protein [bacterium]|nr:DUF4243 domain-containing protein [bacterium]
MPADYRAMEPALDFLSAYGPDLANGFTTHAPMVAEALAALGRVDAVLPWLEAQRAGLLPRPAGRAPIAADRWAEALGRYERVGDWSDLFARDLAAAPWRQVLVRWTARLLPGLCAAAAHGVIRVGHAARSLADAETPLRVRELGDALALWAASYRVLPASPVVGPALPAAAALARVPRVPAAQRVFTGTIVSSLEALDRFAPFADVLGMLAVDADPADTLSDLSETFARVFLANARDPLAAVVFVHAVTDVTAIRSLLAVLPPAVARVGTRYAWQASAALYAAFATTAPAPGEVRPPRESAATLVDMAVASGDDHAIKLTEACLREHARRPSPVYLAAVRRALAVLGS